VGITDKGMECIAMDCGKTTGPVPAKRSTIVLGSLALVSILALVATMLIPTWLFAQEATGAEVSAIAELHVIPGHEAAVRQAVQQVQEATLKDPGCAYFFVTARRDELSTIVLFEEFRSEEAF
jgi:Antibiotic biosynthesis monooxygenase